MIGQVLIGQDLIGKPPARTHEHVVVLMGGLSAEREVSSRTACSIESTCFSRTQRASRWVEKQPSQS